MTLVEVIGHVRAAREKMGDWHSKARAMEDAGIPNHHTPADEALLICEGLDRARMILESLQEKEAKP